MDGSSGRRSRLAEGLRRVFDRSPARLTTPAPAPTSHQLHSDKPQIDQQFWDEVLRFLAPQHRAIVQQYTYNGVRDVTSALDGAYAAAVEKRKECEAKRWTYKFRGKTVQLSDAVDNVIAFLDRFKPVGDVAVNADPIHACLPWAGIRLILEVAVSERHQMAALVIGLHTSLYILNRLKVYFEYYADLPASAATSNMRAALLELCSAISGFLVEALSTFQKNTALRTIQALWRKEAYLDFEEECDRIAQHVEAEAHNCDRQLSAQDRRKARDLGDRPEASLKDLQRLHLLQYTITALHDKFDLSALHAVNEARFDSHDEEHNARCLAGTRVDILKHIERWPMSTRMNRSSGSTVGRALENRPSHVLGAGDRCKASRLFTTIAAQLAQKSPGIRRGLIETLNRVRDIAYKTLSDQFDHVIFQPLLEHNTNTTVDLVIVIDALDELDSDLDIGTVLRLIRRLGQVTSNLHLRVFVTSRPEVPLRSGFLDMIKGIHRDIILHEVAPPLIEHDIALFMEHEFASIRNSRIVPGLSLSEDWPGQEAIRALVQQAVPLFIFAATTCRFIGDPRGNPKSRLKRMLNQQNHSFGSQLDRTYQPVLEQLLADQGQEGEEGEIEQHMELIGSVVLLADPLSAKSISTLLQADYEDVCTRLSWLHSVLSVLQNPDAPVRPLHLSFREFLVDPRKRDKSQFWVDKRMAHELLATRCVELLLEPGRLKEDICNLEMLGTRRADVRYPTVRDAIPAEVAYACRYWVYHAHEADLHPVDDGARPTLIDFLDDAKRWGPELQKLEGHGGGVSAVAFSADGQLLASASDDQTVRLWNPATGEQKGTQFLGSIDISGHILNKIVSGIARHSAH
ncbi:MAG: hypothetical protein Q9162_007326 [Coniocarpon cinnabarinum]